MRTREHAKDEAETLRVTELPREFMKRPCCVDWKSEKVQVAKVIEAPAMMLKTPPEACELEEFRLEFVITRDCPELFKNIMPPSESAELFCMLNAVSVIVLTEVPLM